MKAAYLLVLGAPLALGFTRAAAWLDRRGWLPGRVLPYAWLAAHSGAALLAYAG